MAFWTRLFVMVICFACVTSLPTTKGKKNVQEESEKDDRLKFEPQGGADDTQQTDGDNLSPETAKLLEQAEKDNVGREAPKTQEEIGARAGESLVHEGDGHEEEFHKDNVEEPVEHEDAGALKDGFVHDLMHDGKGNHEQEDEKLRQIRPADAKDVKNLNLSQEVLKHFPKDAFKDGDDKLPDGAVPGPKHPEEDLHGVLMHGDTETGKDHSHEDIVTEDASTVEDVVNIPKGETDEEEMANKDKDLQLLPPKTLDAEVLIHGEGGDRVHKGHRVKDPPSKEPKDIVLDDRFMHNIMHGGLEHNEHNDDELMNSKVIRPRDLQNLGLDPDLLKHLDLDKMIKDDMDDYNKFMSEKGGYDNSIWNILNTFKFRYFKNGDDIDDISKREPPEEEWDTDVVNMRRAKGEPKKLKESDKVQSMTESELLQQRLKLLG